MSNEEILEKYHELYKIYIDRQIDDYEVFIRSRVIESLRPISNLSLDELSQAVNHTLAAFSSSSFADRTPGRNDEDDFTSQRKCANANADPNPNKKCRRLLLLPLFATFTCLAVCAVRFVIARRMKT